MNADSGHNALDIKGEEDFAARVETASAQRVVVVFMLASSLLVGSVLNLLVH